MKKILLLAGTAAISYGASAQAVHFVQTDDTTEVYRVMRENGPSIEHINDVPRFALVGKDGKFYVGLGANVKFVGDFDFGAPLSDPNRFAPGDIAAVGDGDGGKLAFSAAQSNFYMNFVALPGSGNQIGVYVDVNFMGKDHTPALHHAYLKYRGITAGHTISIFTDKGAEPASIDYFGPNAMTFVGHPNISYTQTFGRDRMWSAAIGLDLPEYSATNGSATANVNQRVPDIPIYLQRSWADGKGWFRGSAIFRTLTYRNMVENKNENAFGWGVKVSGRTPICGGLSAMWQAVYGKGVASYIQDLSGRGLDLSPAEQSGRLDAVQAWAAYGTLRYDFSRKVYMNATYSQVRTYAERYNGGSTTWSDQYRYAQYVTANIFWNINRFAQFGAEYLYGRRVDYSGLQAHDNRISLMLQVSF